MKKLLRKITECVKNRIVGMKEQIMVRAEHWDETHAYDKELVVIMGIFSAVLLGITIETIVDGAFNIPDYIQCGEQHTAILATIVTVMYVIETIVCIALFVFFLTKKDDEPVEEDSIEE